MVRDNQTDRQTVKKFYVTKRSVNRSLNSFFSDEFSSRYLVPYFCPYFPKSHNIFNTRTGPVSQISQSSNATWKSGHLRGFVRWPCGALSRVAKVAGIEMVRGGGSVDLVVICRADEGSLHRPPGWFANELNLTKGGSFSSALSIVVIQRRGRDLLGHRRAERESDFSHLRGR